MSPLPVCVAMTVVVLMVAVTVVVLMVAVGSLI